MLHVAGSHVRFSTTVVVLLSELVKQLVCLIVATSQGHRKNSELYAGNTPFSIIKGHKSSLSTLKRELLPLTHPASCSPSTHTPRVTSSLTQKRREHVQWLGIPQTAWLEAMTFGRRALRRDAWTVSIPAGIFVAQNNLFLGATARLQPSYFQAAWQVRLLPTALVAQWMLGRQISAQRWRYLFGIVGGVITLQLAHQAASSVGVGGGVGNDTANPSEGRSESDSMSSATQVENPSVIIYQHAFVLGNIALVLASICSALGNVTMEKIYEKEETDFWVASFQMSIFSVLPAIFLIASECVSSPEGLLAPFAIFFSSSWPWLAVAIQAAVGVLGAMTTKYAGSVPNSISGVASIALLQLVDLTIPVAADAAQPKERHRSMLEICLLWTGIIVIIGCTHRYFAEGGRCPKQEKERRVRIQRSST